MGERRALSPSGGAVALKRYLVAPDITLRPEPNPFWSHRASGRLVTEWWAEGGGQSRGGRDI